MKHHFYMLSLLLTCAFFATTASAQKLVLATEADVWGAPQAINLNSGGKVQLRTMFIKHYGTTCVFKIEISNIGTTAINETVQLTSNNSSGMYTHWATDIKIKPGEIYTYEMERRECAVNMSKKKQKDITKCAACAPIIYFLKK